MVSLINGLGGSAGFGENELFRTDDGFSAAIDITPIFENGLNFFGQTTTSIYLNANGSITFYDGRSQYTPAVITETSNNPEITPFFADVDTRVDPLTIGGLAPTPGGTSTGSNQVYYDFDFANDRMIFTWDDVGYYNQNVDLLNAFQLVLTDQGGGDFDIEFRYEAINWTTGDASGGVGGLGGTIARAGFTPGTGDPTQYFELPQSGSQSGILGLETAVGNTGQAGRWLFEVRSGVVGPQVSISPLSADRDEGDSGATAFTFEVTRSGDTSGLLTLNYDVTGTGSNPANGDDFVSGGIATVTSRNETTIPSTGQALSVSLTVPDGTTAGALVASGFVGAGAIPEPPINIAYVIDVSGSTNNSFVGDVSVGDQNGDGRSDSILDAEIAAFDVLNQRISAAQFDAGVNVALIPFDSSASIALIDNPTADGNGNGVPDIVDALRGLNDLGSTNFEAALQRSIEFFSSQPAGDNFVFFLSDGFSNTGGSFSDEVATLLDPNGINAQIRAVGVGSGASESQLDLVDDGIDNNSVQIILDPDDLSPQLSASPISAADIDRVEIYRNGVLVATVPGAQLASTPLGLRYDVAVPGLTSADDTIEARVIATDAAATSVSTSQVVEQISGTDLLPSGTVTFAPGETTRTLTINVQGDQIVEADETFSVTLSQGSAPAQIVQGTASATIRNDDQGGAPTILGTPNADVLAGTPNDDTIQGLGGNDAISGLAGWDLIAPGAGNDTIDGGDGFDDLDYSVEQGSQGVVVNIALGVATDSYGDTDVFVGMEGAIGTDFADELYGSTAATGILLSGLGGDDILFGYSDFGIFGGGSGTNLIVAYGGSAEIYGGDDVDYILTSYGDNTVNAGGGNDWVYLRYGTNVVDLGEGYNLVLSLDLYETSPSDNLADSSDTITGGSLDDYIYAGRGEDVIDGAAGNDWLAGGEWSDTLTGGAGYDRFIFSDETGYDVITDFNANGEDFLDFTTSTLVNSVFDLTIVQSGTNTFVGWNNGASGVTLQNVSATDVTAADILV